LQDSSKEHRRERGLVINSLPVFVSAVSFELLVAESVKMSI
jgi:hypothetical protein